MTHKFFIHLQKIIKQLSDDIKENNIIVAFYKTQLRLHKERVINGQISFDSFLNLVSNENFPTDKFLEIENIVENEKQFLKDVGYFISCNLGKSDLFDLFFKQFDSDFRLALNNFESNDLKICTIINNSYLCRIAEIRNSIEIYKKCGDTNIFREIIVEERKKYSKKLLLHSEQLYSIFKEIVYCTEIRCKYIIHQFQNFSTLYFQDIDSVVSRMENVVSECEILASKLLGVNIDQSKEYLMSYEKRNVYLRNARTLQRLMGLFFKSSVRDNQQQSLMTLCYFSDNCNYAMPLIEFHYHVKVLLGEISFAKDEWLILEALSQETPIIGLVYEIVGEDVSFLLDAVEEYSEELVTPSTVADFINVKQFLENLIKNDCNSTKKFLEHVRKCLNNDVDVKGLDCSLKNSSASCSDIKDLLLTVTDKGGRSKEIIMNILNEGKFSFIWDDKSQCIFATAEYVTEKLMHGEKSTMHARKKSKNEIEKSMSEEKPTFKEENSVHKKKVIHDVASLNDIKSRACIMTTDKNTSENKTLQLLREDDRSEFIKRIDAVNDIIDVLYMLRQKGHFNYIKFNKSIHGSLLENYKIKLYRTLENWKKTLKSKRDEYKYLNFVFSDQLWKLYNKISVENLEIMNFVRNLSPFDHAKFFNLSCQAQDAETKLNILGENLREIFENISHERKPLQQPKTQQLDLAVPAGQVYIAALSVESKHVVTTVLSLYYNSSKSLPEPHELLICDQKTSLEEIEIFLNRCLNSICLHCLVCIEELELELQYEVAQLLGNFHERKNSQSEWHLAVILRSTEEHPLLLTLPKCIHRPNIAPNNELKSIIDTFVTKAIVVTSDLPGQGKTERIRELASDFVDEFKGIKTLPIYQFDTKLDIIFRLRAMKLKPYNCLHLDIKCEWSTFLDTLIFELIVLQCVHSETTICHLNTQNVFIEIANTTMDSKLNDFAVRLLKSDHLRWKSDYNKFLVSNEIQSNVQIVCNYLALYDDKKLDKKIVHNEVLSDEKCRYLLTNAFQTENMTFSLVHTFVNVLAVQLRRFSASQYLAPKTLRRMRGREAEAIRTNVMKKLIDSAAEFANRSVKKGRELQRNTLFNKQADETSKTEDITEGIISWHATNHLLVLFHASDSQTVSPLYSDLKEVDKSLQNLFEYQMGEKLPDLKQESQEKLAEILKKFVKINKSMESLNSDNIGYVLTPDNLLKMVLIATRMQACIPVVVIGETGCGKTSLVRYLSQTCKVNLRSINIHAGFTLDRIYREINDLNEEALKNPHLEMWVFMDEVNTCEHVAFIADFICHRQIFGKNIAPNIKIIAACNPYRHRSKNQIKTAGIDNKIAPDAFAKLAYRVHPLPENLMECIWDYGSLMKNDEILYINKMMSEETDVYDEEAINLNVKLIIASQNYIKEVENNMHCVSLRDVHRARTLLKWFSEVNKEDDKYTPIILTLAHCYMSRLANMDDRKMYLKILSESFKVTAPYISSEIMEQVITRKQDEILNNMDLPFGIVKNTALRENVFIITVCILNRIPVFLVGKPGCSKSLSMQLIRSNLRGKNSKNEYFQKYPQIHVMNFQGSETATSEGIEKVFNRANEYATNTNINNVLPVVLLDEVGLAEISRFNPLKVLHSLLEPPGRGYPDVAVVGISNWALDAAKMNRVIYLSRTDPTKDELANVAIAITRVVNANIDNEQLNQLACAYNEYIELQPRANFHGLRDFYSMIKCIVKEIGSNREINVQLVIGKALQRNFNGTIENFEFSKKIFTKFLNFSFDNNVTTWNLIEENVCDETARHLMIVNRGDTAIESLKKLLSSLGRQFYIIHGSSFENDQTEEYSYRMLKEIILYLEKDIVLILKDLDSVYGSLYDLLNKNYVTIGTRKKCRIPVSHINLFCDVHDKFKCIVILDEHKLLRADPPFLNRFEKQFVDISHLKTKTTTKLENDLKLWLKELDSSDSSEVNCDIVFGQSDNLITSLALYTESECEINTKNYENCLEFAKNQLLWLMFPDVILRASTSRFAERNSLKYKAMYKSYLSLPLFGSFTFIANSLCNNVDQNQQKFIFFTHSVLPWHAISDPKIHHINLSGFKNCRDLEQRFTMFWNSNKTDMDDINDKTEGFVRAPNDRAITVSCAPPEFLVVYCRWPDDEDHILFTKQLMEAAAKKANDFNTSNDATMCCAKKHMIIVVHVSRSHPKPLPQLTNFLSDWKLIAVDNLNLPKEYPSVISFVNYNLSDIFRSKQNANVTNNVENGLWNILNTELKEEATPFIDKLIYNLFPSAFLRISYQSSDIRNMEDIVKLMTEGPNNKCFLQVLGNIIIQDSTIRDTVINDGECFPSWLLKIAQNRQQIHSKITFTNAVYSFIEHCVLDILGKLIFILETNSYWPNFTNFSEENEDFVSTWERLLREIIGNLAIDSGKMYTCAEYVFKLEIPCSKHVEKQLEEPDQIFFSKFKFSPELHTDLGNKTNMNKLTREYYSTVFNKIMKSTSGRMIERNALKYVRDFCRMKCRDYLSYINEEEIISWFLYLLKGKLVQLEVHLNDCPSVVRVTYYHSQNFFKNALMLIATLSKIKCLNSKIVANIKLYSNWPFSDMQQKLHEQQSSSRGKNDLITCTGSENLSAIKNNEIENMTDNMYLVASNASVEAYTQPESFHSRSMGDFESISVNNELTTVSSSYIDYKDKNCVTPSCINELNANAANENLFESDNSDFEWTTLTDLLLPLLDADILCQEGSGRLIFVTYAAALRVANIHPLIDFLDIIRSLLILTEGDGTKLNKNLMQLVIDRFKASQFKLSDTTCLLRLEELINSLYNADVAENKDRDVHIAIIIYLCILESDLNNLDTVKEVMTKCLNLLEKSSSVLYFRPVLLRILSFHVLELVEDDDNEIEKESKAGLISFASLQSTCLDSGICETIMEIINNNFEKLKLPIIMLTFQSILPKRLQMITPEDILNQNEVVINGFMDYFYKALSVLVQNPEISFHYFVSVKLILELMEFLSVLIIQNISELKDGKFDFLLEKISNVFTSVTCHNNRARIIMQIIIAYLLKEVKNCTDRKNWYFLYSLLQFRFKCTNIFPTLIQKPTILPWYPLNQTDNYSKFLKQFDMKIVSNEVAERTLFSSIHSLSDSFHNTVDLLISTCLMKQDEEDRNIEVAKCLARSYLGDEDTFQKQFFEAICNRSFRSSKLNFSSDTDEYKIFQASLALEVAKRCAILKQGKEFAEGSIFDFCLKCSLPFNLSAIPNETKLYVVNQRSCMHRLYFHHEKALPECIICNRKTLLTKSYYYSCDKTITIGYSIAKLFMDVLIHSALLVAASIGKENIDLSRAEQNFDAAWKELMMRIPDGPEFACKLLHIILVETLDFTCKKSLPLKDDEKLKFYKNLFESCLLVIQKRYKLVRSATLRRYKSNETDIYWHERLLSETDIAYLNIYSTENACRLFFSTQIKPSEEHFKKTFNLTDNTQHPFLSLFFEWKQHLPKIKYLLSIWQWHCAVCNNLGYKYSKEEIKHPKLFSIRQTLRNNKELEFSLTKLLDDLQTLSNTLYGNLIPVEIKHIKESDPLCDLLIEDNSSYLYRIFVALADIQNKFLSEAAILALETKHTSLEYLRGDNGISMISSIHLARLDEKSVIDFEWSDDIIDFVQNNTEYGMGNEVQYDFEIIETRLARELLFGKSYLLTDMGMNHFHFKDELLLPGRTLINNIKKLVGQVALNKEQKEKLSKLSKENEMLIKQLHDMIVHIVWILKMTSGESNDSLRQYITNWKHIMPKEMAQNCINCFDDSFQLCHVAGLYQELEFLLARNDQFDGDSLKNFHANLENASLLKVTEDNLRKLGGESVNLIVKATYRLLYRLTSKHEIKVDTNEIKVDTNDTLIEHLKDWTLFELSDEKTFEQNFQAIGRYNLHFT